MLHTNSAERPFCLSTISRGCARAASTRGWWFTHARAANSKRALPGERDRLRFIPDAWFHKLLFRLSGFLPRRIGEATLGLLSQLATQHLARKIVLELIAQEGVDLVHQPIPVSPRFPSLMTGLGVPVVIGPMNGGMEYPAAFRHAESRFSRIAIGFGRRLSDFFNSLLPGKKRADVLLVANERTRLALPAGVQGRVIELVENGVHLKTWSSATKEIEKKSGRARFVFMGRLVDWKALDIVIEALGLVPDAELVIIGDGPMREPWRRGGGEAGRRRPGDLHRISSPGGMRAASACIAGAGAAEHLRVRGRGGAGGDGQQCSGDCDQVGRPGGLSRQLVRFSHRAIEP